MPGREGSAASGGEQAQLVVAITAAIAAISTAAVAIRLAAPLESALIAAARVSVTAIVLGIATRRATAEAAGLLWRSRRAAGLSLAAGLCLAAHFAAWIASLQLTSVVRSVALVSTAPLFAGLFARALGDRASPRLFLGALVAIGGTLSMIEPSAWLGKGGTWTGDLLALSGAVTAAAYLAFGRAVHRELGDALPVEGYFVLVNVIAAVSLWAFALLSGVEPWPSESAWPDTLAVLWLGLIPGLLGHGLLNWAVRRVPVHVVSLAVLLEPIGAALLAWPVLAEVPSAREALGALALLAGVGLGLPRKAEPEPGPDLD